MHELMITQKIVQMIEQECRRHNINAKRALLEVGEDTTYKSGPIMYYYNVLLKDLEVLSNCKLEIRMVRGNDVRLKEIED
jgi:Zn finger protein HypA/HybF involved in hydrogenase expression